MLVLHTGSTRLQHGHAWWDTGIVLHGGHKEDSTVVAHECGTKRNGIGGMVLHILQQYGTRCIILGVYCMYCRRIVLHGGSLVLQDTHGMNSQGSRSGVSGR